MKNPGLNLVQEKIFRQYNLIRKNQMSRGRDKRENYMFLFKISWNWQS